MLIKRVRSQRREHKPTFYVVLHWAMSPCVYMALVIVNSPGPSFCQHHARGLIKECDRVGLPVIPVITYSLLLFPQLHVGQLSPPWQGKAHRPRYRLTTHTVCKGKTTFSTSISWERFCSILSAKRTFHNAEAGSTKGKGSTPTSNLRRRVGVGRLYRRPQRCIWLWSWRITRHLKTQHLRQPDIHLLSMAPHRHPPSHLLHSCSGVERNEYILLFTF